MCHRDVVFSVEAYGEDASDRLIAADAVASSQRDIAMKLALPVLLAALIGSPGARPDHSRQQARRRTLVRSLRPEKPGIARPDLGARMG